MWDELDQWDRWRNGEKSREDSEESGGRAEVSALFSVLSFDLTPRRGFQGDGGLCPNW